MSCWLCGHHCTSRSMAVTCLPERPRWSDLVDTSNDSFLQSPPRPLPLQDDSYREPLHPCELELGTESREGLVTHMQRSADLQVFCRLRGELVHASSDVPRTPDASDRSISKRRWEEDVRQWRSAIRKVADEAALPDFSTP
eukprot:TRINITY_DN10531_c0_g1_i1.p2 TRINITY_DN10531_c0_g1~~TRINITY_DN10531_c0_g1_i1.p2  ORF type:complete len:141 (+),score=16.86 TRINITY_DN10531_c0_g1_i1:60-482(+)